MYKVGDKVKIKSWEQMVSEYGYDAENKLINVPTCNFVSEMKPYCGKEMTIKEVHKNVHFYYLMYEDNGVWEWCTEMIEKREVN